MQNMNQIHQSYAKIDIVKHLNAKVYHKNFKSKTLTLRSCTGVGVVRRKILDQSLSSFQTWTKYIMEFGNNEVLKTLNVKL